MNQELTALDLNVWWDQDYQNYRFTMYSVYGHETKTSEFKRLDTTPERVQRYLQVSEDDDWWTSNLEDDFYYILWGEKVIA